MIPAVFDFHFFQMQTSLNNSQLSIPLVFSMYLSSVFPSSSKKIVRKSASEDDDGPLLRAGQGPGDRSLRRGIRRLRRRLGQARWVGVSFFLVWAGEVRRYLKHDRFQMGLLV